MAAGLPAVRGGARLHDLPALTALLDADRPVTSLARERLGAVARPVRAILFDKTPDANWSLGWHQDRTICVADRRDVPGFGPWTVKQGLAHVQPPFAIIESMLTMRVHLDPVDTDNAPLLVAPGSHRLGRIAEADYPRVVERCGTATCLAEAGDIWLYHTPILHVSAASVSNRHRRVLQLDFSAASLPGGLRWKGV